MAESASEQHSSLGYLALSFATIQDRAWCTKIERLPIAAFLGKEAHVTELKGKIALVTGGASGIGLGLAAGLAARGCRVVVGDILDQPRLEQAATAVGGECMAVSMDVTNDNQVAAAVAAVQARFGGLDIVVNNAGLYSNISRGPFEDIAVAEWERVFAVNVTGVFRVVKACLPLLKASGYGRILNISSSTVFSGPPNMVHYVSSKGAITAMTKSMARELGLYGITVNAIAPGFTLSSGVLDTAKDGSEAQWERARAARAVKRDQVPDDLIGATCFLASEGAGFITGQTLVVDGGAVMH
jgi:NAD(P)-dependent dehydrogenase (short-subunit alcohol dehydrogenase family)